MALSTLHWPVLEHVEDKISAILCDYTFQQLFEVPRSKKLAFCVSAPKLWNSLQNTIKDVSSLDTFKTQLKSYLYPYIMSFPILHFLVFFWFYLLFVLYFALCMHPQKKALYKYRYCIVLLPGSGLSLQLEEAQLFFGGETLWLRLFLLEKPPPCIRYFRQFSEANATAKNALMATMVASDDEAVKVPVFCHRLGQALPTLSKKSVFPCRQIVQWRLSLIVDGSEGEMQPSLHPKHCRSGQVVFSAFLVYFCDKTCIPAEVWVMPSHLLVLASRFSCVAAFNDALMSY